MQLIRGLTNLSQFSAECAVTIGNFDGVHLGHRALVGDLKQTANSLSLPTLVVIFEPQPLEFFQPKEAPARLMTLRDKVEALKELGVDYVCCVRFNEAFRSLTARQFVEKVLVHGVQVRHLVVGDDFHFGSDRSGDFEYLERAGQEFGFTVVDTPSFKLEQDRVSSTLIRDFLVQGDFVQAAAFLGRPYQVSGHVVHGDKIGRTIDFPTANLRSKRLKMPVQGVIAVRVLGVGGSALEGVANIGRRPTVNGVENRIEVHLLDFSDDIYGKYLRVEFLYKLRDEKKFAGLDELKKGIERDVANARIYFSKHSV